MISINVYLIIFSFYFKDTASRVCFCLECDINLASMRKNILMTIDLKFYMQINDRCNFKNR